MCGRFALYAPHSRIRDFFDADVGGLEFSPRYNIAPMQLAPVIRQRPTGERVAHLLRWGLIPSWSKDENRPFPWASDFGFASDLLVQRLRLNGGSGREGYVGKQSTDSPSRWATDFRD